MARVLLNLGNVQTNIAMLIDECVSPYQGCFATAMYQQVSNSVTFFQFFRRYLQWYLTDRMCVKYALENHGNDVEDEHAIIKELRTGQILYLRFRTRKHNTVAVFRNLRKMTRSKMINFAEKRQGIAICFMLDKLAFHMINLNIR